METPVLTPSDFVDPDWDTELPEDVIDWRRYLGGDLRDAWSTFTDEQKRLLAENSHRIHQDELTGWPED
ncbi:MAG: hypothetical protein J0H31_04530 [Alphaproteobacteria bacterium]|nr:hypothetical protein [Alphaproteobacteria bacterium]